MHLFKYLNLQHRHTIHFFPMAVLELSVKSENCW